MNSVKTVVLPPRFTRPSLPVLLSVLAFIGFVSFALVGAEISIFDFFSNIPAMWSLILEMLPPDISRIDSVGVSLVETFQMVLAGTFIGVLLSLPMAVLASKVHSPNFIIYRLMRALISFMRTVPDLIWALFFVATVGLGPFAGVLTLIVDTIGFCGRFFAEALEETDPGSQEALKVIGAKPAGIFFSAALPAALPSFVNTSLFSLEKATRSSVVLGLVGAGGIGIELKVAMETWHYGQAATIMLLIFIMVMLVEQVSTYLRSKVI